MLLVLHGQPKTPKDDRMDEVQHVFTSHPAVHVTLCTLEVNLNEYYIILFILYYTLYSLP